MRRLQKVIRILLLMIHFLRLRAFLPGRGKGRGWWIQQGSWVHSGALLNTRYPWVTTVRWNQIAVATVDTHESNISQQPEETWLVVGDGDFSYSTQLAQELASRHPPTCRRHRLFASVLESEASHALIYQNSSTNVRLLRTHPSPMVDVKFEIDATRLEQYFPRNSLQRIIFNFPHWPGKSNHRYNRQLLSDFFASSAQVLCSEQGRILIALCHGQGGIDAHTLAEWKESWRVPVLAAEHGFLLLHTEPFVPKYQLSSHRGVDRPFPLGDQPLLYTFGRSGNPVPTALQIAYRFELRLVLQPHLMQRWGPAPQAAAQTALEKMAENTIPPGIRCDMPLQNIVSPPLADPLKYPLLVILVVLAGESMALTRHAANSYKARLEAAVDEYFVGYESPVLRKGDRHVSHGFPYHLLGTLLQERGFNERTAPVSEVEDCGK